MIDSGWIFPDGTEYACGCDSIEIHPIAVEKFIRGLRFQDLNLKNQIEEEVEDFYDKHGPRNLYDKYAIYRLGWIKVNCLYSKNIQYAGYDWQQSIVKPYEDDGYDLIDEFCSPSSYLPLTCNVLLAINNGGERYNSSGEFNYDGTDEDDYYVDENGVLHDSFEGDKE